MGEDRKKRQRPKPLFFIGQPSDHAASFSDRDDGRWVQAVVIVVVMAVRVIVPMAVVPVLRIVTDLATSSGHRPLEVLQTVGMVMVLAEGPVLQQRVSGK